jgi:hypothetical protein
MTGAAAPAAGDSVPWLASFRAAYPGITVSPPDSMTVDWTAHRAGTVIARDPRPERLRDRLDYHLAQERERWRDIRPVIGEPADPRAWVRVANAVLDRAAAGDLPAVAAAAGDAGVAPGTAARAYQELERRGILQRIPGSGYRVADRPACPPDGGPGG